MRSAQCDGEDFAGARSPCSVTKPQFPRRGFSYLCIEKCLNGSIIIETLIKILNLKDQQIGSGLATCSALRCFRAALHIAERKPDPVTLWLAAPKGLTLTPNL